MRRPLGPAALLATLLLSACGAATPTPQTAANTAAERAGPPPYDPVAALPEDTVLLVHIRVDELRQSPTWERLWGGFLRSFAQGAAEEAGSSIGYLDVFISWLLLAVDDVWIGVGPAQTVAAFRGSGFTVPAREVETGDLHIHSADGRVTMAAPQGGDVWVVGDRPAVDRSLRRLARTRGSFVRDESLVALQGRPGVALTARLSGSAEDRRRVLTGMELPSDAGLSDFAVQVATASLQVSLSEGLEVTVEVELRDRSEAESLERELRGFLDNPMFRMLPTLFELPPLDEMVSLLRVDTRLTGQLAIPPEALDRLIDGLDAFGEGEGPNLPGIFGPPPGGFAPEEAGPTPL